MKTWKSLSTLVIVAALILVCCVGCAETGVKGPAAADTGAANTGAAAPQATQLLDKDGKPIKIGVTFNTFGIATYVSMYEKEKAYCEANGIELMVADIDSSDAKLLAAVESFVEAGCQAISVSVLSADMPDDIVASAVNAGTFLVAFENRADWADFWCGADNYECGKIIGQNAADWINATFKEGDDVNICIAHDAATAIGVNRIGGAKEVVEAQCSKFNLHWIAEQDAVSTEMGVEAGENFLQACPDVNVVICVNDPGGEGVLEAFKAANHLGDKVGIFACDCNEQAVQELQNPDSVFRGTVAMNLDMKGVDQIKMIVKGLQGGEVEDVPYDRIAVTKANVQDYIDQYLK
jgi:ABC-type sugar transport system substrate-binding protein